LGQSKKKQACSKFLPAITLFKPHTARIHAMNRIESAPLLLTGQSGYCVRGGVFLSSLLKHNLWQTLMRMLTYCCAIQANGTPGKSFGRRSTVFAPAVQEIFVLRAAPSIHSRGVIQRTRAFASLLALGSANFKTASICCFLVAMANIRQKLALQKPTLLRAG